MNNYITISDKCKFYLATFVLLMVSFYTKAQDTISRESRELKLNVEVEEGGNFYFEYWWAIGIGVAVFVIIIVALVSAGRRS